MTTGCGAIAAIAAGWIEPRKPVFTLSLLATWLVSFRTRPPEQVERDFRTMTTGLALLPFLDAVRNGGGGALTGAAEAAAACRALEALVPDAATA